MRFSNWIGLFALIAATIILWSLRDIILQVFAGIILAMALCTLTDKIRSLFSIPRSLAFTICLIIILTIFCLSLVIIVPPFTEEFQQLIIQLPYAARALWEIAHGSIEKLIVFVYGDQQANIFEEKFVLSELNPFPDGATVASGLGDWISKILGFAGNLGSGIVQVIFIIAVALMVSLQPEAYREAAILLVPAFYRKRARSILLQCGDALSNWMGGILISCIFVALLTGIGLSLLGIKLVIANALLAGTLNIIPNIGPFISTIFPVSVALLDEPWKALPIIGLYIIIQNIESYLITPSIMHRQVKLLPGITLISQFILTVIFGGLGLLLSLPLTVIMQVLIKEVVIHDLLDTWKKKRVISNL